MSTLLFARHGNTFEADETVRWAGAQQDYPLTDKGQDQARAIAHWVQAKGYQPEAVYCSALQRAQETASIVCDLIGLDAPIIDSRLHEIDYGATGGFSDDEMREALGAQALEDWNKCDIWPEGAGWSPQPQQIQSQISAFMADMQARHSCALAISSNGILRFALKTDQAAYQSRLKDQSFKVKTGHVCVVDDAHIVGWNINPKI